jgi:hypothetical protein
MGFRQERASGVLEAYISMDRSRLRQLVLRVRTATLKSFAAVSLSVENANTGCETGSRLHASVILSHEGALGVVGR